MKGPYKPNNNDLGIYREELKGKIPDGKKVVCDNGYRDQKDPKLSNPNSHDAKELLTFKARCRMRQETFNSRIKQFYCLKQDGTTWRLL